MAAQLSGMRALGVDLNPIAALYAKAVTHRYPHRELRRLGELAIQIVDEDTKGPRMEAPDFVNRDHWFSAGAQQDLSRLLLLMSGEVEPALTLLRACFAVAVQAASRQDSETRYARVERQYQEGAAIRVFGERLKQACEALLNTPGELPTVEIICGDTRNQTWPGNIDLVVTSPPYVNTYDYYLYHKQKMNWLGFDFVPSRDNEIGSRLNHSSRKLPVREYTDSLAQSLAPLLRNLRRGGHAVVVIGDGIVGGEVFDAGRWMNSLGTELGLQLVDHTSVSLDSRTARFNPSFRSAGKLEHTIVFRR
jgi:site-specific DNA-methyltransferase (cytosine-N4-specific)